MSLCPKCGSFLKQLTGTTDFICNDMAHWIPAMPIYIETPIVKRGFAPNAVISEAMHSAILAVWDRAYQLKRDGLSYGNIVRALELPMSPVAFGKHFRLILADKGEVLNPKVGRYAVTGKPRKRTRSDGRAFGAGASL